MTTATKRRPKRSLTYNSKVGALWLTAGKEVTGFWLDELATDFGPDAYACRLTRIVPPADGSPASYDVVVSADVTACECRGHLKAGRCKHADSVRRLRERGDL